MKIDRHHFRLQHISFAALRPRSDQTAAASSKRLCSGILVLSATSWFNGQLEATAQHMVDSPDIQEPSDRPQAQCILREHPESSKSLRRLCFGDRPSLKDCKAVVCGCNASILDLETETASSRRTPEESKRTAASFPNSLLMKVDLPEE